MTCLAPRGACPSWDAATCTGFSSSVCERHVLASNPPPRGPSAHFWRECFSAALSAEGPSTVYFTLCKEKHFLKLPNQVFLKIKMNSAATWANSSPLLLLKDFLRTDDVLTHDVSVEVRQIHFMACPARQPSFWHPVESPPSLTGVLFVPARELNQSLKRKPFLCFTSSTRCGSSGCGNSGFKTDLQAQNWARNNLWLLLV